MAAPGANLWHFRRRLPGASAGGHHHGPLWRSGGAQENVHPQHPADGAANPAIGLLPTYSSVGIIAPLLLLLMRILQGAAIGGEVPGAWVFVAEHVPEKRIGIACGTLTAGLTVGILLGSVVATLINTSLTPQDPRRRLADPLPAGRRIWSDSDVSAPLAAGDADFLEMQQRKALAQELPVKAVALKHQKAVVISMLLTAAVGWRGGGDPDVAGLAAEALWFCAGHYPAGQQHRHHYVVHRLSARRAGSGPLRRQPHFIVGSLLLAVASWAFYHLAGVSPQRLFLLYGTVGLCVGVVGRCPM